MKNNFDVSSDQENRINEILESGINEIKNKSSKIRDESFNNKIHENNYLKNNKNEYKHESRENSDNIKKNNKLKYFLDEIKRDDSRDYNYEYIKQIKQKNYLSLNNKGIPNRDNNHLSNYLGDRDIKLKSHLNDFSQFRNELTNLQSNIDNLERKLFDNASISITSPLSSMSTNLKSDFNTNFQTTDSNFYNYPLQDKNSYLSKIQNKHPNSKEGRMTDGILNYTKNILERGGFSPSSKQNIQNYQSQEDQPEEYKSVSFKNNTMTKNQGNEENLEKFITLPRDENNQYSKIYQNRNESLNSINVFSSLQSNNMGSYKENENKYHENQHFVEELKNEIYNLETKNKTFEKECEELKIKNHGLLNELIKLNRNKSNPENNDYKAKFQILSREYESLSSQYEKSERIRDEQNSLIRSLQREIDILRDTYIKEKISVKSNKGNRSRDLSLDRKTDEKDRSIENPFINNINKHEKSKSKKKRNKSTGKIKKTSKSKTSKASTIFNKKTSTTKDILENNIIPVPLDKKKKNNSSKPRGSSNLHVPSKIK